MISTFKALSVIILAIAVWIYTRTDYVKTPISLNTTYDYIIVGAGSAGSVLAARLSEDPTITVLLLEAGDTDVGHEYIHIPLAPIELQRTNVDWNYVTVPQQSALKALEDNRNFWPRGRVYGGSSSLNYLAYVRGSRYDYDSWAADGCSGWSYTDVLPYFIKSEDVQVPHLRDSPYHGVGGPLTVSPGQATQLSYYYSKAMKELGYDTVDCNGESQIGYEPITLTTRHGHRCSTATAFLHPASTRPNLHISASSLATKIVIQNKTAVGVQFVRDARKYAAKARKEVIISGGSINSPQILMLSGIGPKKHLESLGISVKADLPVGQYLQDHLFVPLNIFLNESLSITPEKANTLASFLKLKILGTGYLVTSGLEGNAFFSTVNKSKEAYANIQLQFFSGYVPSLEKGIGVRKVNFKKETDEMILKKAEKNRNGVTILPVLLHPKSTGTITLRSKDPFDPPIIDPQYLTRKEDMDSLLQGVKTTLKLIETKSFNGLGVTLEDVYLPFPECTKFTFPSDEYWECYIRHYAMTVYHPTTTCRMGDKNDPTAVVDPLLRVKGIANLRVVDASVMRNVPSGNTNAPTVMIAERAADLIKGSDSVKKIREKIKNIV